MAPVTPITTIRQEETATNAWHGLPNAGWIPQRDGKWNMRPNGTWYWDESVTQAPSNQDTTLPHGWHQLPNGTIIRKHRGNSEYWAGSVTPDYLLALAPVTPPPGFWDAGISFSDGQGSREEKGQRQRQR